MKIKDIIAEAIKQRLDPKCWKGKHKEGTKIKGGIRVNNCVPNEGVEEDREHIPSGKKRITWNGIDLVVSIDGATVDIRAMTGDSQMAYVVFDRDGDTLVADDLAVEEQYKGQGIAKIMYDYVKELGFRVKRSSDQLVAGKKFWDKNKGAKNNIWEQGVAEDRHPNDTPPGPETKPTMPKGTVRVDVSDVYDWYKLGKNIPNLKGLSSKDFGKGPPSTIVSFGSEEEEHKYIKDLEKLGLTTTDIDPVDPNQPPGMKRQKVDPTFNVSEADSPAQQAAIAIGIKKARKKPKNESADLTEEFDLIESAIVALAERNQVDAEVIWEDLESLTDDELYVFAVTQPVTEDWQKVNKHDRTSGMSQKAVNAYRREHPGSKLKTAVTTKPSKLKRGSKSSKRRKSYCSRSRGQMKMHHISCAKTPDKAICAARRRWNC